ncbi:YkgJ family cysteine cluster protein [Actinobacillus porcinus]|uniref:YkgJ family cysteine cluster protein n=1 Tax=Actinobacillus porcinus TaxID=51048 RepID=UPI002355A1F0|nr:YkgJ family cysteine cluster protein [Actinobacillus porcinus]
MMMNTNPFPCTACGKCCRRVNLSEQTAYLDRGDGVCKHFDEQTNLCKIYENRPLVCRVEDYYKAHLSHLYSWDEFIKLNLEICHKL